MGATKVRVRGNLVVLAKKYILQRYPENVYLQILEPLDQDVRRQIDGNLRSLKLYDIEIYQQLLESFKRVAGTDALAQCGISQAENQLSGLFGLVARTLTRDMLIGTMNRMWRMVFDTGHLKLVENEVRRIRLRVDNFEFTDAHLLITEPYFKRIIELVEKKIVQVEVCRVGPERTDFKIDL